MLYKGFDTFGVRIRENPKHKSCSPLNSLQFRHIIYVIWNCMERVMAPVSHQSRVSTFHHFCSIISIDPCSSHSKIKPIFLKNLPHVFLGYISDVDGDLEEVSRRSICQSLFLTFFFKHEV